MIEPTINGLLKELKGKALSEGVLDFSGYCSMVDELIWEKISQGELNLAEDVENIKENLLRRWDDVKEFVLSKTDERT